MPEDPELERDRLTAYSLRQSRRYAGAVYASSSTGTGADDDDDNDNDDDDDDDDEGGGYSERSTQELRRSSRLGLLAAGRASRGRYQLGSGSNDIRSSWRADPSSPSSSVARDPAEEEEEEEESAAAAAKGKDRMVDVRLDQSHLDLEAGGQARRSLDLADSEPFLGFHKPPQHHRPRGRLLPDDRDLDDHPPGHLVLEMPRDDSPPPSFQQFKRLPRERSPSLPFATPQPPPPPSSPPPADHQEQPRDRPHFLPQETKRTQERTMVCNAILFVCFFFCFFLFFCLQILSSIITPILTFITLCYFLFPISHSLFHISYFSPYFPLH